MTTLISIRISEKEKEKLQRMAEESELSLSYIVRRAIKEFLANYD